MLTGTTGTDVASRGRCRLRAQCAVSLLAPVLLFVLANLALSPLVRRYPLNGTYVLIQAKWEQLLSDHTGGDFLILGDSSALHGVDPDVLDQSANLDSTNFGSVGNLLVINDAWMLGKYVKLNGAPRGVLAVHAVDVWNRPVEAVPFAKVPLPWGYWRDFATEYPFRGPAVVKMAVIRYLPLSTDNETVARHMLDPSGAPFRELSSRVRSRLRRGFWRLPDVNEPAQVAGDCETQLEFIRSHAPGVSEPNRFALRRIGELTNRYGFDVYLSASPVYAGLAGNPEFRVFWAATAREIRSIVGRYRRLHFEDRIFAVSEQELTDTVDHLTGRSSARFTRHLAAVIARSRPAEAPGHRSTN